MEDFEKDLREQGVITSENKVKEEIYFWAWKRIMVYTHPREYKYMESDEDQRTYYITLDNADPWQRQILEILEQYPDE